ncbi:MAG: nuclear transport factor 2 family protein, partial [Chlamydiales bacterium]|nr:nuclear transport factor 2 family protein [Chlamydiales bacterium]
GFCISFCSFLTAAQVGTNAETSHSETTGYRLVNRFWTHVMKQDVRAYSNMLACNFQGLNIDGIYNRQDQITGLSSLSVTSFQLKNLTTSRSGKTLVISYDFYATGDGIVSGPSIDVWHKSGKTWKQISHSYVPF